jgi:death-on-curing protein
MIELTLEQLLELHALVISETGGSQGLRDIGRLESALAAQTQNVFGQELYGSLHEKSAALIRGIIADHAFVDSNKRTGMLAGLIFLEVNGIAFKAKKGEIEDFAVRVATERLDVPVIASWLKAHCK